MVFVKEQQFGREWLLFLENVASKYRRFRTVKKNEQSISKIISQKLVKTKGFDLIIQDHKLVVKNKGDVFFESSLT